MESVGFIGLGIMGSRQAANLARAGFELTVHNRTRERADAWAAEHGGVVAATPRELAERSDVVITMVVDGPQVEALLLGEDGALAGARPSALFVDMSTIAPSDARRLGATLREHGHGFVDAPVTGSAPRAEDGTLTIMVGGEDDDVARAMPLFEAMLRVMGAGAANSQMLQLKGGPMLEHDFEPLFKLEHMLKDVVFCLEEARAAGAPFPFAALAGELYSAGAGRGLGERDFAAVLEVAEGLTGAQV